MTDTTLPAANPKTIRWGRLLVWALLLGLLAMVGWKLWRSGLGQVSSGPAPDFTLNTFDGPTLRLSELKGKAVVVNFWASWCIPCRSEAPILERTWRTYQDKGVVFVGVGYLDDETSARKFLAEFDVTYPNGPDVGTRIAPLYRVRGIPETFFVDRNGIIARIHIGAMTSAQIDQFVAEILE